MTTPEYKQACIFGGTGFIGRQIVRELARRGYTIKIATRAPENAYHLRTAGQVGQIVPFGCDYRDEASLREAVRGCELVVNCVGILYEKGRNAFSSVHTELPRAIAKACRSENVGRLIHISALGCDHTDSKYGKSKYAGERALLENFPKATIVRPSVVFGVEDNFFNMFARLSVMLPVLPLIGGGHTKLQPVYVADVAAAIGRIATDENTQAKLYELGGPDVLSFRQLYEKMFEQTGRRKALVSVPWPIARLQGAMLGMLPAPLLTADQVETLKTDNTVTAGAMGFKDLGLVPTNLDVILPTYLVRFRPGGRFGDKKRA